MSENSSLQARRVMQQIEHKIPAMNHKAIDDIVGKIYQSDFEALAQSIAIMRAKYLKKVVDVSKLENSELSVKSYADIRHAKLAFEEAIDSFSQLKRALERGHFTLSKKDDDNEEFEHDEESDDDSQGEEELSNED